MKRLFLLAFLVFSEMAYAETATLNWKDNSNNEAGFKIERNSNGGAFAPLPSGAVGPNVTSFIDHSLVQSATADNTYCYRVQAFNQKEASTFSNVGCKTISKASIPVASSSWVTLVVVKGQPVTINWTAPPNIKPNATDWIALYLAANSDRDFIGNATACGGKPCWFYTKGAASGTWTVTPPDLGPYNIRYLLNDGFVSAQITNQLLVK